MKTSDIIFTLIVIIASVSGASPDSSETIRLSSHEINRQRKRRGYYLAHYRDRIHKCSELNRQRKNSNAIRKESHDPIDERIKEEETRRKENIFDASSQKNVKVDSDDHIYVNAQTGSDSKNGSTKGNAVKTLNRAMNLVKNKSRPLKGDLIVHLAGTFSMEQLKVRNAHRGTSATKRVIFRGDDDGSTTILGGNNLNFVKVSSLGSNHPARKLAEESGTNISNLYAAAPPSDFPSNDNILRWSDGDCRDLASYGSPPTLAVNGIVMTRSREPNLPKRTASTGPQSMGETRDAWLRVRQLNKVGKITYKPSAKSSINKASNASWNSGSVVVHIFPLVDWYDARVRVGQRSSSSNQFSTITKQKAPGNPEGGKIFRIVPEARYYLEGAVEYLDSEGEYHVGLGEVESSSRGWTLFYPSSDINMEDPNLSISLSLRKTPAIDVEGEDLFVTFENLRIEGSLRYLAIVYAYSVDFNNCSFINAGHDAIDSYGQNLTFRNCIFEGLGGSALQLSDDRDIDTDGKNFALLESGNALVDSLVSDFASTCRHYSEGVGLGGYGTIISNNHFRSSNMAAIDVVGGGFRILHNVFSHVSDGSYDDGAIHWVAESPMERGTEVGYNIFFRNGVSYEPCNAETSCYQADIYMDDMAGAMTIHGNVMIKDKVLQTKPTSSDYSPIHWVGIFINGGADVSVYENAFLGPVDFSTNGAIYGDKTVFYEQTCGGTIWPDDKACGNTGVCSSDDFYKRMRQYGYNQGQWKSAFPELSIYDATPQTGGNWYCANRRSCPMAAWNNTIQCNSGIGSGRELSHRAIWPTDKESELNSEAREGKTVPFRSQAVTESGNKAGTSFGESVQDIDVIEKNGIDAVLVFAQRVATEAETKQPNCDEGSRGGAARSQLAGRFNNPCTDSWSSSGMSSCDPCVGGIQCSPRDMPEDGKCSCGTPPSPIAITTPAPSPSLLTKSPTSPTPLTSAPVVTPLTPAPAVSSTCKDSPLKLFIKKKNGKRIVKNCKWVAAKFTSDRCKFVGVSASCPFTCGACSKCVDSPLLFKFNKKARDHNILKRKCIWVFKEATDFRCAYSGVKETCRNTCGLC